MSVCRSCNQPIEWIKLESGKFQPVDLDYLEATDCKTGDVLVTDSGKVLKFTDENKHTGMKGRISHFATCPDANKWRKNS